MASATRALLDANVLYGQHLRSLLLYLAEADLFRPHWTDAIQREWLAAYRRNHPALTQPQLAALDATARLMDATFLGALVTGGQDLVAALTLPDPDDRHVLAAAIACRADCIVTFNLRDFPRAELASFGLRAVHPDAFLLDLRATDPGGFDQAVLDDRLHYRAPPFTPAEYLARLTAAGLPRLAAALRSTTA